MIVGSGQYIIEHVSFDNSSLVFSEVELSSTFLLIMCIMTLKISFDSNWWLLLR